MPVTDKNEASIRICREARGRVRGDGVELAFGYWPGRGDPVVALHGLTASYLNFIGVAEQLHGRRPLLALDLRGRGDSDKPAGPYGMAQHANDVATAVQAMGFRVSWIVGHSMGAFVATALAAQFPELVAGLVLIDGGYVPALPPTSQPGLDAALALRLNQLRAVYRSREAYRDFWRTQPHFPPEEWSPWIEAFLDYELGVDLRPKASEVAVCADLMEGLQRAPIIARLQRINIPVLMLRAPCGFTPGTPPLFPDTAIEQMRAYVPAMKEEIIPNTTHYTIVLGKHGATRVADLIVDFASGCRPERLSTST